MVAETWKELIERLMEERDLRVQYKFAEAVGVSVQTVSRWMQKKNPEGPKPPSLAKVARFMGISSEQLKWVWARYMVERQKPYAFEFDFDLGSEVKEAAASYDGPTLFDRVKAVTQLDLSAVAPEQLPSLQKMRAQLQNLVVASEATLRQQTAMIEATLAAYEEVYQGAVDVARREAP